MTGLAAAIALGLAGLQLGPAELKGGAVAAGEENATRAGVQILEAGGNAVDAAVATGFALAVTLPRAGNLGGGGFFLYRDAQGEAWFLDYRETAPAAAHAELYLRADGTVDRAAATHGWRAAGVPGSVPGLLEALERWGSLDRRTVLAPAIRLAREGFRLSAVEQKTLAGAAKLLRADPLARRIFLDADGAARAPGALILQPELAATLEAVAELGVEAFRDGPVVEALLAAARAGGGILTEADFRDYRPVLRRPHRFEWRGMELLAGPPPSSGGIWLQQVLAAVEGRLHGAWDDPETVLLLAEASARAFADRNRWLGDPAGFDFDPAGLVAPELLAARRAAVRPGRHTRPARLGASEVAEGSQTTHFSVVGPQGAACSVTTTLNSSFGAAVMAPGGFLMNNEMDDFAAAPGRANQFGLVQGAYNAVHAGRRPLSSMAPVIVVKDGRVDAVAGSPGGPRILSAVLQVLLHRYRYGMSPERAVSKPRFHRQDRPGWLYLEPGRLRPPALVWLLQRGQEVHRRADIGAVHAVFRLRDGTLAAVSDPRRGGLGLVLPPPR